MGRFVNADSFASTGQGLIGNNMFAYCNNNPVCCVDPSGEFPWLVVAAVLACVTAIGFDHYLAKEHPDGIGVSVRKDTPYLPGVYATGRKLFAEGHGFEFSHENGITICDLECGMLETSYGTDHVRASGMNLFTARATIEADWSGYPSAEVSGLVSMYSANAECLIPLPNGTVELAGAFHAGALGAGLELDAENGKFEAITPLFPGIVVEWDVDFDFNS